MDNTPLTPEEILDKYIFKGSQSRTGHASIKAMNEYASQQTAILQARVVELEQDEAEVDRIAASILKGEFLSDYKKQRSRISKLERENANHIEDLNKLGFALTVSQQHAEKLMGLLEKEVNLRSKMDWDFQDCDYLLNISLKDHQNNRWQSYCKEHGLQSPEKTDV